MELKKYAASRFIGVEDLRDGPRQETIVSMKPGKYDKPVATFEVAIIFRLTRRTSHAHEGLREDSRTGRLHHQLFIGPAKHNGDPIEA
jgi:hypothetical protein